MPRLVFLVMFCAGWGAIANGAASTALPGPMKLAIEELPQHPLEGRALTNEQTLLRSIYATAGSLLWSRQGQLSAQARELGRTIHAAQSFGLIPRDYGDRQLATIVEAPAGMDTPQVDIWLTLAAARLLTHLHDGRIDPRRAGFELNAARDHLDVASVVIGLASTPDVDIFVAQVEPHFYHYALLKLALARYRQLALDPTLTELPPLGKKTLHQGDVYAGSSALRKLLLAEGDLPVGASSGLRNDLHIDASLSQALKRYQARHGLPADGSLSSSTRMALTTPFASRVRQIELTLERWRWLPAFSTPPIIVNIPQFQLFAFNTTADRAASILQMPVIVGQSYPGKRTPIFVGDLKTVIFRPYWDIPRSITLHEMLPELRRHPDALERNHLELVRGESETGVVVPPSPEAFAELATGQLRLRQRPSADNALGLVKFVFPNAHSVYMHSTPAHQLFLASRRAFSHGCIRVSDPVGLAEFVLRNAPGSWDRARIEAAMQGTSTVRVELMKPIPVMILYGTAMATEAGPVEFFDDIYGHDRELATLLSLS